MSPPSITTLSVSDIFILFLCIDQIFNICFCSPYIIPYFALFHKNMFMGIVLLFAFLEREAKKC